LGHTGGVGIFVFANKREPNAFKIILECPK
jgi:hypothetical protein